MLALNKLNKINIAIKYCVFGYVRECATNASITIPKEISLICLIFYHHGEYFEKAGDDIKISDDQMSITKIYDNEGWKNSSFGHIWIDSMSNDIAKWTLKVDKLEIPKYYIGDKYWHSMYIYFVSKDDKLNDDCGCKDDLPNYGFSNNKSSYIWDKNHDKEFGEHDANDAMSFGEQDTITIILDMKQANIKWIKNNDISSESLLCDKIDKGNDIQYKLAISLWSKNITMSLIDFSCS